MPQIFMLIAPEAQDFLSKEQKHRVESLGELLKNLTEKVFEIEGKDDIAFDVIHLFHAINEKLIQIEIRYTAGEDEYDKGEPFNPSDEKKKELAELIKEKIEEITKINPSVWIIPISDSVFVP